ncbi:uncharacterized protein PAC_09936 [Phialocephala subalpina]|uniref:Uncharacterized protein n=1 Tax=Phialocephala subalpina TaxID=576137 RepID=A0A1L7X4U3_9HELO|nr:uncharacterized protein PAC_09936 [Phialocephala subalpina]
MCKTLTTTYLCKHVLTADARCPLNPGTPFPKPLNTRPSQEMIDTLNQFSFPKTKTHPLSTQAGNTPWKPKHKGPTQPPNSPVTPPSEVELQKQEETHAVNQPAPPIRALDECPDYEGKRNAQAMTRCEDCEKLARLNDAVERVDINDSSSRRASREDEPKEAEEKVDSNDSGSRRIRRDHGREKMNGLEWEWSEGLTK